MELLELFIIGFVLFQFRFSSTLGSEYYVDFDYEPRSPRIRDTISFKGLLISTDRNKRGADSSGSQNIFTWYFKRLPTDTYGYLTGGKRMNITFWNDSFEGFYKLVVSLSKTEKYEIFTEKYIRLFHKLSVALHIKDKVITSTTKETHVDLKEGDTFDWKCQICGVPESYSMLPPRDLRCKDQKYEEPDNKDCLEFSYKGCRFLSNRSYGCTARNVINDVYISVILHSDTNITKGVIVKNTLETYMTTKSTVDKGENYIMHGQRQYNRFFLLFLIIPVVCFVVSLLILIQCLRKRKKRKEKENDLKRNSDSSDKPLV